MSWNLTGNATAATNFLGTTDNEPLVIKTNNNEAVRITSAGNVGIGTIVPQLKLHVDGASGGGILGISTRDVGVAGFSTGGVGVRGVSSGRSGVLGASEIDFGVKGLSSRSVGVAGLSTSDIGVFGRSVNGPTAGFFDGNLEVVNGNKTFKIDHPLDPENKYLVHNAVESSARKNIYDGVVRLDKDGAAEVGLPEWFDALNGDFCYQLTAVGGSAPGLHVAEEISENRFKIAGGQAGMKVCWQVTGSRRDPWAAANPFEVEQEKPEEERGRYLEPSLYDAPEEQRVLIGPIEEQRSDELMRLLEERRRVMEELRRQMERPEEAPPESP
jgi:hypothetical protein